MNPEDELKKIILQNGFDVCKNRFRCKSIISDHFNTAHIKEKHLLFILIDEGFVEDLILKSNDFFYLSGKFEQILITERCIQPEFARWSISAWAYALGIINEMPYYLNDSEKPPKILNNSHNDNLTPQKNCSNKSTNNIKINKSNVNFKDLKNDSNRKLKIPYYFKQIWSEESDNWLKHGDYNRAIDSDPNNIKAWYELAKIMYRYEIYIDALNAIEKVLKLEPNNDPALLQKGLIIDKIDIQKKNCSNIIIKCDKLLNKNENDLKALKEKGKALYCLGKKTESISIYNKILSINPKDNDALDSLYAIDPIQYKKKISKIETLKTFFQLKK